jgi:hypothetical protein
MLNARFLASNTVISLQHVLLFTKRYARDARGIARLKKDTRGTLVTHEHKERTSFDADVLDK